MIEFKPMEIDTPYYEDNKRVSNTGTSIFIDSPARYEREIINKEERESVSAFRLGSMEHMWILQKEEFWKNYEILEFETPKSKQQKEYASNLLVYSPVEAFSMTYSTKGMSEEKVASESIKLAQELDSYIKYLKRDTTKEAMSFAELQSLKKTEQNIKEHKLANKLLYDFDRSESVYAMSEFHINWIHEQTGLPCKSLLDRLIIDTKEKEIYLVDIKTTQDISKFYESYEKWNYAKQFAWYWKAITYYMKEYANTDITNWDKFTYVVGIKNHDDKEVRVFRIPEEDLIEQDARIELVMKDLKWHYEQDIWNHKKEYYYGNGSESLR